MGWMSGFVGVFIFFAVVFGVRLVPLAKAL